MRLCERLRCSPCTDAALLGRLPRLPGSEVTSTDSGRRYLHLTLANAAAQCAQAWIDVDAWMTANAAELPGIAWQQVPLPYLTRWLQGKKLNYRVGNTLWTVRQVAIPATALPDRLIRLPSHPYPLLCQTWPTPEHQHVSLSERIPFALRYVLGTSSLLLSQLVGVAEGDLIRISHYDARLVIGQYPVFHFCLTEDLEVFVEEHYSESAHDELRDEEEMTFDWTQLPIEIEFVLASLTLTAGELDTLEPGTQLPLARDAEKKVKIYLNRKLFARGELVALDDGTLAVEVNQLNSLTTDFSGYSYVEQ